jgi:hypothetical protein
MKLLLFIIVGGFACFIFLMIWAETFTYKDPDEGTTFTCPDKPLHQHDKMHGDPDNEYDASNLDLEKTLKTIKLREKLRKIEKEKL